MKGKPKQTKLYHKRDWWGVAAEGVLPLAVFAGVATFLALVVWR